ncbi:MULTISPECIES: hypothetical protein [Micromonospora]|uniref:Uncharacterized protein n=2 Tax=Micromonospora TaxID=1873 RepID=A0A9X0I1A5_9ACTN|nr:hypothetical protein [Micromonospora maris]AEB45578.1 hypothetical protein VAB18032_22390 [Micromonospora maris AB-18-032]AIS85398.1 hypothetical protein VASRM7_160 [Verrucosispora sp. MS100047]KUJ44940.1 hypothetical protein ADL17_17575 [Micromonospora maris]
MSDNAGNRPSHTYDRPEEVTDPLLWRLALDVAEAHAPAEDGGCAHLLCAGQDWPCGPWEQAQRALSLAQGGSTQQTRTAERTTYPAPFTLPGWQGEQSRGDSAAA